MVRTSEYRSAPLIEAILVSWLIAGAEYAFRVPANRIGYGTFTAYQLKIIQEVITLVVFAVFAFVYLGRSATAELRHFRPVHPVRRRGRVLAESDYLMYCVGSLSNFALQATAQK